MRSGAALNNSGTSVVLLLAQGGGPSYKLSGENLQKPKTYQNLWIQMKPREAGVELTVMICLAKSSLLRRVDGLMRLL